MRTRGCTKDRAGSPLPAAGNKAKRRAAECAPYLQTARTELDHAVSGLRRAGQQQYLPLALLTRAWQRSLTGVRTGPESAQSDLDEAWEIAARGPMPLFMADVHLYRARLFGSLKEEGGMKKYPWEISEARSRRGAPVDRQTWLPPPPAGTRTRGSNLLKWGWRSSDRFDRRLAGGSTSRRFKGRDG